MAINYEELYHKEGEAMHEALKDALIESINSHGIEQGSCDEVYGLWRFMNNYVSLRDKK